MTDGEGGAGGQLGPAQREILYVGTCVLTCIFIQHVKPIISALANSSDNLNPTSSPTDPLTITVPIPSTTKESREAAKALALKKGEEAMFALREARGSQKKMLRAMELGKQVGPDDLRRAEGMMEKVNERAVAEGKKMVESARKGLDG